MVLIIMGVSGCGKTTVGKVLADRLGLPFYDGDDFHPASNVDKMQRGEPLTDGDRLPWLRGLAEKIALWEAKGGAVLACSALKGSYRKILAQKAGPAVRFAFLNGGRECIRDRLQRRSGHYMPLSLLDSQFAALEPPAGAITVAAEPAPETVAENIVQQLNKQARAA